MKTRALVIGMALATVFAGCGITAVGSLEETAPGTDSGADVTRASLIEASLIDTSIPPSPTAGPSEVPISDLDAGADAETDTPDAQLDASTDATVGPAPFAVVASGGGTYHLVSPPGTTLPCSVGGNTKATLVVRNLAAEQVAVQWINYSCAPYPIANLGPNTQVGITTYNGHRWVIRNVADGSVRGDFVIDTAGTFVVTLR